MTELWLATSNKDKVKEFKELLSDLPFCLKSLSEEYASPAETGSTFMENAWIKADSFLKKKPGAFVLAEDSGIEVKFLNNRPGVYSARYKGKNTPWPERLKGLLDEMKGAEDPLLARSARMTSALAVVSPQGKRIEAQGVVEGSISFEVTGGEGFGYDFVFIPAGESKTIAELGFGFKNKYSHRFRSVQAFKEKWRRQEA